MRTKSLKLLAALGLCWAVGALPVRAVPLTAPNPVLAITAAPFPLVINQAARITITATNAGPDNADNVVVTDAVPNNMAIAGVATSQGDTRVSNSAITVHVGQLAPNQTVTIYVDVVVVAANASDAPFYNCAGLTYLNGVARLSCLPNQPAVSRPARPPNATLAPNGSRPIDNPNRPPVFLPIAGASPIDLGGIFFVLASAGLLAARLLQRKRD